MQYKLEISNLTKRFGEKTLFEALDLTVTGPVILWAPSGWGKTTLLRILMGLEVPTSGTVTGVYAVNSFAVQAGDTVTDHGSYTAVRNMTTSDAVEQSGDTVTVHVTEDGKLYYEGTMDAATALPWVVKLTYTLDGAEISPDELGGKSGALSIRLQVSRNPDCTGDFFDQYALQVTMTLDTDRAQNIVADGATMANVGSNKQLSYILLPGSDSDVTVTADVTDFAMNAISLNGVKLRLNLDLDGADLTGMLDRLQSGSVQLDDGANALADGIAQVQAGIDTLNGNSAGLTRQGQGGPDPDADRPERRVGLHRPAHHPAGRLHPDPERHCPAGRRCRPAG